MRRFKLFANPFAGPFAGVLGWLTLCLAVVTPFTAGIAHADGWQGMKGKIVISDAEFGTGYASDAQMVSAVRKQAKTVIKGDGGAWTMNLMVFLKEPAGTTSINIVYYDVSVKPRDQVNFSEVTVQASQRIVQVNGVAISKDLGFVKGHKYEVLATRLIGGKEKVYAKGVVTLK
ncbi:MAG: hypothetical protein H7X95_13145 [Deltaproteobacteria bacterium]|nr:hypothetical protein [Deltaproteobacteria bacterium]